MSYSTVTKYIMCNEILKKIQKIFEDQKLNIKNDLILNTKIDNTIIFLLTLKKMEKLKKMTNTDDLESLKVLFHVMEPVQSAQSEENIHHTFTKKRKTISQIKYMM